MHDLDPINRMRERLYYSWDRQRPLLGKVRKIYLAASYSRRVELAGYADLLREDGHLITAEWLSGMHEEPQWTETLYALHDQECIEACDTFVGFTEPEDATGRKRGGRHVEYGIAVAMRKELYIVGPRENCFYFLPGCYATPTFDDLRAALRPR